MRWVTYLVSLLVVGAMDPAIAGPVEYQEIDLGMLTSRLRTVEGDKRVRALGPFVETRLAEDGRMFNALRPFYSRMWSPGTGYERCEYLWPLGVSRETVGQRSWRFLNVIGTDFDTSDPESRYRMWVVPFLLKGRNAAGKDYFAVFPLGGTIYDCMTLDRSEFFLFPLYSRNSRAGVDTVNIMWPVLAWRDAEGSSMFRLFPLYGRSSIEGKSLKRFFLWPIWTEARYEDPEHTGYGYMLFPFFGRIVEKDKQSWLLFPPFFRWTKGDKGTELTWPWPFLRVSSGEVERFDLWPIIGVRRERELSTSYVLWPFISTWYRNLSDKTISRWSILPVFQWETHRARPLMKGPDGRDLSLDPDESRRGKVLQHSMKVWPLFRYRTGPDSSAFSCPALWPAVSLAPIDRNYAPIWTLASWRRVGDAMDAELLWGAVRHRIRSDGYRLSVFPLVSWFASSENGGTRGWSVLKGMLSYTRDENGPRARFMWLSLVRQGGRGRRETIE